MYQLINVFNLLSLSFFLFFFSQSLNTIYKYIHTLIENDRILIKTIITETIVLVNHKTFVNETNNCNVGYTVGLYMSILFAYSAPLLHLDSSAFTISI